MDRRKFIKLLGGGVVVAAAAGAAGVGYAVTRTTQTALKPWELAGSAYSEPRKRALSYAVLAPNPHNMQPWQADLSRPNQIVLTVDTDKLLPHTDPMNRQITIGQGCFLELLVMAGAQDGYRVEVDLFPEGQNPQQLDGRPIAVATFTEDSSVGADPLFESVLTRRSAKDPFDVARPVTQQQLLSIQSAARDIPTDGTNEESLMQDLRAMAEEGILTEMMTPRTHKESIDVIRIGRREVDANPDGIDLTGPLFEALLLAGQISRPEMEKIGSPQFEQAKDGILAPPRSAQGFVWLTSATNDRVSQIQAGRDWVRMNLEATRQGLGLHPLSQILQEYQEMKPLYDRAHAMLAPDGGTLQMLGRVGYTLEQAPPSPRWPVEAKIIAS
ncbi:MAG: twin-arginine translocation pathway signal protein [Pseudomonadota bacterium]